MTEYVVKYAVVKGRDIFNYCGPQDIPTGWTMPHRIKDMNRLEEACGFYSKLEADILENGFRNPILAVYGHVEKRISNRIPVAYHGMVYCRGLGGSRLWVAQKHDLPVPCLVADFKGTFPGKAVPTPEAAKKYFADPPDRLEFATHAVAAGPPVRRSITISAG